MRRTPPPPSSIDDPERAMASALRLLGYRARSEHELRARLTQKGFTATVIDRTLATLARQGLVDDRDFARDWVALRPGRGPARYRQELRQKGIHRDLAESVITGISADEELASALHVARRALRARTVPPDPAELMRVRRLLQRRGFSYEVIGRVITRLGASLTADGEWLDDDTPLP
jgi:regulatory protein